MSAPIIEVSGISKKYRLGQVGMTTLRDDVQRLGRWLTGRSNDRPKKRNEGQPDEFWALHDVSFTVEPREIVGIIGRNGAGKSTLLKILSQITEPTSGEVKMYGRVGSLLEVGTGFHPELSGRDNVYLNGTILGMRKSEIAAKFDEIVEFAEIGQFIDTPVKRYSSGMYVRLAFAVAAHLDPEILILDEVLAVGDHKFQRKCLGKIQDVSQRQGRTILLVSHTMATIVQLANRCLVLDKGLVQFFGAPSEAVKHYMDRSGHQSDIVFDVGNQTRKIVGTQSARILTLKFLRNLAIFEAHEDFVFELSLIAITGFDRARVSMTIFALDGTAVGSGFSADLLQVNAGAQTEVKVLLPCPRLAPGSYYCGVAIGKGSHKTGHIDFDVVLDTLHFEVCAEKGQDNALSHWSGNWGAVVFEEIQLQQ